MNKDQTTWEIGLSSWIIKDGNYRDFETGQVAEFALEFYSKKYNPTKAKQKSCKCLDDGWYKITGEVIYLSPKAWVVDFGISAFRESKPPKGISLGSFVAAKVYLGIDPFFYFERLYKQPGMPPLVYSWKIDSIRQQTAPFLETQDAFGRMLSVRDENKLGYKTIKETDAWHDDNGCGEYIFTCQLLDVPTKFKTETAT